MPRDLGSASSSGHRQRQHREHTKEGGGEGEEGGRGKGDMHARREEARLKAHDMASCRRRRRTTWLHVGVGGVLSPHVLQHRGGRGMPWLPPDNGWDRAAPALVVTEPCLDAARGGRGGW
jgi:hypothetical protein